MRAEIYPFELGGLECVVINDFPSVYPLGDLVLNAEEERLEEAARALDLGQGEVAVDYDCLLVRTGDRDVLVDAG
jgi:hypothetical protein